MQLYCLFFFDIPLVYSSSSFACYNLHFILMLIKMSPMSVQCFSLVLVMNIANTAHLMLKLGSYMLYYMVFVWPTFIQTKHHFQQIITFLTEIGKHKYTSQQCLYSSRLNSLYLFTCSRHLMITYCYTFIKKRIYKQ